MTLFQDKLKSLAEDEALLEAVREVFNEAVENEKPRVNEPDGDLLLGQKYRAYELSKKIIEQGFTDIRSYKIGKQITKFNKGR